jgi:hypothetical protein
MGHLKAFTCVAEEARNDRGTRMDYVMESGPIGVIILNP